MLSADTDVVVIGSGIGGMCAAALLAKAGHKVIVLESLDFVGGRYTCIDYNGHKIPTGGHIMNHGKDDPIYHTLEDVVAPEIQFREFKVPVKYRIGGTDHDLAGRGGLNKIVAAASKDEAESKKVMGALYTAMKGEEPTDTLSLHSWLLQHTDNKSIHNVFRCQSTAFTGVNTDEFPAAEFIRFLRTYARLRSALVPKGTGKSVIDAFRTVIEGNGGRILTTTRATRILVSDGRVTGVIAEGKEKHHNLRARAVISNVGPTKTIALAGKHNFDGAYLERVAHTVRPSVAMDYIIVSERPLLDSLLFTTDAERTETWSPTSMFWPEESPPGTHVIEGYAAPLSRTDYDPGQEYETFLRDLKRELPAFEQCGGRLLVARRFCGDWPINRCLQGHDVPQATPVRMLYNVGDGVKPSGWVGASAAALSARSVAEELKQRLTPSRGAASSR